MILRYPGAPPGRHISTDTRVADFPFHGDGFLPAPMVVSASSSESALSVRSRFVGKPFGRARCDPVAAPRAETALSPLSGYSLPYRSNLNAHADDDGCGCANNLAARKYSGASVAKTFGVMRPVRGALSARASTAHSLSCSVRNLAIMLLYMRSLARHMLTIF